MATIDPNIALNAGRGVQPVDFGAAMRNALAIQGARQQQQQNALLMQERQAQMDRANRLRGVLAGLPGDATDDQRIGSLRGAGFFDEADKLESGILTRRKTDAEIGKTKAETLTKDRDRQLKEIEAISQRLRPVKNQAEYDLVYNWGVQTFGPEAMRAIPAQYDPRWQEQALNGLLSQQQALQDQRERERLAETVRNNQAQIDTQRRGQNMADARAREANQIQRDLKNQQLALQVDEMQSKREGRLRAKEGSIAAVENQLSAIDKALNHPGRESATGLSGFVNPANYIPGTQQMDFRAVLEQIQGTAFLQAFESLKGGGAITEIEGKKAEQAVARLQRTQSDREFENSLRELQGIMRAGYERLAGKPYAAPAAAPKPTQRQVSNAVNNAAANMTGMPDPFSPDAIAAELARRGVR